MLILFTNIQNELMVEIGTHERSHVFSIMSLLLNGLKNSLNEYFSEEEINNHFNEWYSELGQELFTREIGIERNEKIVSKLVYSNIFLNDIPKDSEFKVNITQVENYQNHIIENENLNIGKNLFRDIDVSQYELSFNNKKINCIQQEHKTSCTIACMAMIVGKSYKEVFKEITKKYQLKRYFSTNEKQWNEYLKEYGYSLGEKKNVSYWKDVPDYALCIVEGTQYNKYSSRDFRHAIIFRRQHGLIWLLDPDSDKPKYNFWDYKMALRETYEIKI